MALGATIRQGCERHPEKQALRVAERSWTYAELDAITDRIAAGLMELGIRPGDRVALHFINSAELVFGYYACFKAGAVAVPLNVRLKGSELEYILNHCGARLYVGQADLFPELQSVRGGLSGVERFFLTGDGADFPDVRPIEDLLAPNAAAAPILAVPDAAPAVILYTSGTTARPKGVTHTHATLAQTVVNYRAYFGLEAKDVVGIVLPMAHIFGFALLLLPAISAGATAVVIPRFEPEEVLRRLEEHRVTYFGGLPVMYNALVNSPGAATRNLRSLRFCLAGGDAVPTELQRRFQESFGLEITAGCGMTEVIPYAGNPPYGTKKAGAIGLPTPGVSLRLVDEMGRDVARGEVGEILVRSEATMIGYWEDPEATAATIQDGWLRTGDLGQVDEEGYYWFVGRKKEIIVRGGSNISPLEVEEALYQHPSVREAGVVGVPDAAWGEVVQAFVALKEGAAVTEEALQEFLGTRMAAYKVPERIHFLPDLPKGLTGKIQRKTLWEMAAG
jgi:long-chain acyl-CoA synthetase